MFEPMIEHLPPLLWNTQSTFYILLDALQIYQKETFLCCVVCFRVRAYWHWPKQITIITDQVHISLRSNVLIAIIILPHCIGKQAIMSDGTNIVIVLDNVLVILTSPPIKICDALKPKGGIPLFPLFTILDCQWDNETTSHGPRPWNQHNLAILWRCSPYSRILTWLNSEEDKYMHLLYPPELQRMCKKTSVPQMWICHTMVYKSKTQLPFPIDVARTPPTTPNAWGILNGPDVSLAE